MQKQCVIGAHDIQPKLRLAHLRKPEQCLCHQIAGSGKTFGAVMLPVKSQTTFSLPQALRLHRRGQQVFRP